jgi:hypothetical protein
MFQRKIPTTTGHLGQSAPPDRFRAATQGTNGSSRRHHPSRLGALPECEGGFNEHIVAQIIRGSPGLAIDRLDFR